MKTVCWFSLSVLLFAAVTSFSQEKTNGQDSAKDQPKKSAGLSGPTGGNVLTEDELAALLTEATDEKTGAKLTFSASFGAREVEAPEKRKYAKSGKVPIRITCSLVEARTVGGKEVARRLSGSSHIYIMDEKGKVIFKKTVPLDKMCPS